MLMEQSPKQEHPADPLQSFRKKGYLTSGQLADFLDIPQSQIRKLMDQGKISLSSDSQIRQRRFDIAEVERYLRENYG